MANIDDLNYMNNDLAKRKEQLSPSTIISYELNGALATFKFKNEVSLEVTVIDDEILRFRYSTFGSFGRDFSYAITSKPTPAPQHLNLIEQLGTYEIKTKKLSLFIDKETGQKRVVDHQGAIIFEEEKGFHWEYNTQTGNDIVMMSKKIQSGERFYGLGDKTGNLDLRGRKLQLWGSDTYAYGNETDPLYKNIPFFISLNKTKSYGIFFDNTFRSHFDFGKERGNVYSFWGQGGEMDYYFIHGADTLEVSKKYALLTGTPELPPLWSLGFHQCKWSYFPESKVREITDGFRKRKIPCDAIYLDIDYMDGFRCFTWHPDHFPNPKQMIKDFKKEGFKTVVIIDPGIKIDPDYWVYQEGIAKDYFCHRADGPLMKGSVWPGLCNFPDFTKAEVRTWWSGLFKGLVSEHGVEGVWNDMNEPAVFEEGTFPNDVRFDYDGEPCSHAKAHNIYGHQMAKATYEGMKANGYPNRPFVITRSGYAGLQKYSSVWTGDNKATWEHLKIANVQCQRLSVSGVSFVGSDIGGFIETPSGELFARWIQLGIFHPFCRVHSSGDHNDQEPWSFGDNITAIVKRFIELRYQLLPYIYTSFWQHQKTGAPMLRPLSFLDNEDIQTHYRQEEFGLGDHLLICPITTEGVEGRWMYLPKGKWYSFWNDQMHAGNQEIWADADLNKIPFFVKEGSVIPFYPIQQYVGEQVIDVLTLHLYNCEFENTSILYEDAGNGYDYLEKQDFNLKTFHIERKGPSLCIEQHIKGKFKTTYRTYKIILHGFEQVSGINCDGKSVKINKAKHEDTACFEFNCETSFQLISVH